MTLLKITRLASRGCPRKYSVSVVGSEAETLLMVGITGKVMSNTLSDEPFDEFDFIKSSSDPFLEMDSDTKRNIAEQMKDTMLKETTRGLDYEDLQTIYELLKPCVESAKHVSKYSEELEAANTSERNAYIRSEVDGKTFFTWYFQVNFEVKPNQELYVVMYSYNDRGCGCFSQHYPVAVYPNKNAADNALLKCENVVHQYKLQEEAVGLSYELEVVTLD